jgi:hypothetical protein
MRILPIPIRYYDIVNGDIVKFEAYRYRTGNRHRQIQKQPISYRLSISYRQHRYIGNIVNSPTFTLNLIKPWVDLGYSTSIYTHLKSKWKK